MAMCHCQISDRGFTDAIDMVGPSIEVLRPTSTQTALDAPSGFFTVHLASLKKGLRFPLHVLLIEFLNVVDLFPCQLVPNSHRYIAGYLVRCKDVGVKPTLDHFVFTFKLTKGHKDWASYASLSQRSSKLFASDKKGSTKNWKPFFVFVSTGPESPFTVELQDLEEEVDDDLLPSRFTAGRKRKREAKGQGKRSSSHREESPPREPAVIVVEDQDDDALETGTMAGHSPPHSLMPGGGLTGSSKGVASERPPSSPAVTYEVATEGRSTRLCIPPLPQSLGDVQLETLITLPAEDQARISAASQEDRCVALEADKASLSSEVEYVSARVVKLEGEKSDLIQQLGTVIAEWLKTEPGAQWMVNEGTKSFNCGLFCAQQVFRDSEAYKALSANRLPDGRIYWDAPCPLHSLQCMAWESMQNEHLPLLEHESAYYTSLERWTSESCTSSPVRPKDEVVVGEELGSSLPRPAGRSPPWKAPRRSGVARAASGSASSSSNEVSAGALSSNP
ncbi:unnamed protein product [Cuscuta campestris]|uniref:Transposase (putative) gypsy type domain-containing protein n=1 Tax=Cuscuta campestris TaxID=132261 RepID=A0A484LT45_9ASTE|nr:unnamed protein product [Cuscuta campestris]